MLLRILVYFVCPAAGKTGERIPEFPPLVGQVRDLHVVGIEQLAGGMIEAGHGELIVDLSLQQAKLGGGEFGLRFEHEKDRF